MIRVENLTHHYGVRPVLSDVTFEIATGELVVLLGPNGMGKTTLLGCLGGILCPVQGRVIFDGVPRRHSIDDERALRKRIVYLPDNAWLPKEMPGREFLIAVGRLYGHDDLHLFDHADRLLRLFHLEDKGDRPIGRYSTGQRKKIALASALITEAPYLLFDEPFSGGLDPAGIGALKQVLKRLADDEDVTVVMTTPVPEIVSELAHRIAILREGQLTHFDTPDALRLSVGEEVSLADALHALLYPDHTDEVAGYFQESEVIDGES